MLEEPVAVAVDSRGLIYICDRQTSSIVRYRLSSELGENVLPEDPWTISFYNSTSAPLST
ncbi:MAG: hypothetical protein HOF96_03135 [Candidatus Marinimicrobia bacterium]|nr:hypothetical protein [Candidatus Neomarinimicrobiota bacterium]MBT3823953.1 hypothetical protein [Candidatus Neomarinimicrobiota bacterium]MBT4853047.1 hypothetical protein [Candidatus Neomarinimicrobiota bacterium]MBT6758846.1 hypothetical protein [Candidatus Neomarinimicrobiota bacterium]MBT7578495.1 hypothetical protein [Candidatus Neomarinimicrobiota bacterium]